MLILGVVVLDANRRCLEAGQVVSKLDEEYAVIAVDKAELLLELGRPEW